jgi:hypothetical protein
LSICVSFGADLLTPARSISYRAAVLLRLGVTGRVLASFERVCDLVTDGGEVCALVWGGIGNGPLNVVLDGKPGADLPVYARFAVRGRCLAVGGAAFDLADAELWDARPEWDALRARRAQVVAAAQAVRRSAQCAGLQSESLLKQAGPAVEVAAAAFQDAWQCGARRELLAAARGLCGLGPGLTPAGDDWLAGWLLAQHLNADRAGLRDLTGLIAGIAATRTTTLSRAFLECAAAGEADEHWHALLRELARDPMTSLPVCQSTDLILAQGATSGAAALAGFFAGLETPDSRFLIADSC